MRNFKPGDKVVCIHPEISIKYNKVYTVAIDTDPEFVRTEEEGAFDSDWMELEEIYNSPLALALREEE